MPETSIASITAEAFSTPLHNDFVTSQGRATIAWGVAVILALADGRTARGESVPVAYVTGETVESVLNCVRQAVPDMIGKDVRRYRPLLNIAAQHAPDAPSARCGLEMAILDAWSQVNELSLHQMWGGALESIESDITIPIVPNAEELTAVAWEMGIRIFKIKVGDSSLEADYNRIEAVRRAAPEARLRIDANQAFTPGSALEFAKRLHGEGLNVDLLEQPVPKEDIAGLGLIAAESPIPVFADESCRTPGDALRLVKETGVQGFNLKINKCGIGGTLDIISIAEAAGRKLMLGCMLETRRSISLSLALACGTGAFDYVDLDSHLLLNEEGVNPFFSQEGGVMQILDTLKAE